MNMCNGWNCIFQIGTGSFSVEYKVLLIDKNLALRSKLGQCTTILFPDQTLQHVASKTI